MGEFTKCHAEAYNTYQTQLSHGGDGRPDFLERKTCNWITETFQTCHDNIVATRCKTHYDLNAMVDGGLHSILTNLAATQPDWDSSLSNGQCPPSPLGGGSRGAGGEGEHDHEGVFLLFSGILQTDVLRKLFVCFFTS